uniref:Structural maintenance of chromosomes protein 2 n=1 Tax=Lygus hesperus TaxID=30085 RepID=A0A0A9YHW3_LYGHE
MQTYDDLYHDYQRLEATLQNSSYSQLQHELQTVHTTVLEKSQLVQTWTQERVDLDHRISQLEGTVADASDKTTGENDCQAKVEQYNRTVHSLTADCESTESRITQAEAQEDQCAEEIRSYTGTLEQIQNQLDTIDSAVTALTCKKKSYSDAVDTINQRLQQLQVAKAAVHTQLLHLRDQVTQLQKTLNQLRDSQRDAVAALSTIDRRTDAIGKQVEEIAQKEPWVLQNSEPQSSDSHDRCTVEQAEQRVNDLTAEFNKLTRRVNINSITQYEKMETEFRDLQRKRDQLLRDKVQIETMIQDLDVKKNEAVIQTWDTVNRHFNSIFSTLLPDSQATLNKLERDGLVVGITMSVALGGIWKTSLTELSGGQRSLLALSYILA